MNTLIFQSKKVTLRYLIIFALGCFAFLPDTQAVVPPPDGGYPGGNTAAGQDALLSLTTGQYNTAVGLFSLRSDATGDSIRPLVPGRCFLIPESRIQQLAQRRF
jgi:hypothetical protein